MCLPVGMKPADRGGVKLQLTNCTIPVFPTWPEYSDNSDMSFHYLILLLFFLIQAIEDIDSNAKEEMKAEEQVL